MRTDNIRVNSILKLDRRKRPPRKSRKSSRRFLRGSGRIGRLPFTVKARYTPGFPSDNGPWDRVLERSTYESSRHQLSYPQFRSSETIALLLGREDSSQPQQRPQQRIVTLEQVLALRYMAWLTFENDDGANIYVSANPLLPGSRKRTKECIASVRHIYRY